MKKENVVLLLLVVALVSIVAVSPSWAYGEVIESSLQNLLNWITKVLGGLAVGFGIVFTGVRMSLGDQDALKRGGIIIMGGILCFSAMNIVALLQAIFK